MAEFVERRMQYMISEFSELEKLQILSPIEVQKLIDKRREFEYKISKKTRKKQDYINYVVYDTKLLELLFLRRKEFGEKSKRSLIEGAICRRISHRLSFMCRLWPSHLDIWTLRITFLKSKGLDDEVSTIYDEQTRFHGNLESVWVAWASWEIMKRKNFIKARDILLSKARKYHPNSIFVAREYFRLEIIYDRHNRIELKKLKRNGEKPAKDKSKVQTGSIPEAIYKDSVERFPAKETYLQFYEVCEQFKNVNMLKQIIFKAFTLKYPDEGVTWELRMKKMSQGKEFMLLDPKTKLKKIFHYYDKAKLVVGATFVNIYFKETLNLLYQTWCMDGLFNSVTEKMISICKLDSDRLSTFEFMTWFYISRHIKCPAEDLKSILTTAISVHPHSSVIRLQLVSVVVDSEDTDEAKLKAFTPYQNGLSGRNGLKCWIKLIQSLNEDRNIISMLEKGAHNVDNEIAIGIRIFYLDWIFKVKGMKRMRTVYKKYEFAPPLSNQLHAAYINQELKSKATSIDGIRKAFDVAVMQYGTQITGLWLSYIEFERKYGTGSRVGHITSEARDKLDEKHLAHFIDLRYIFDDQINPTTAEHTQTEVKKPKSVTRCFVDSMKSGSDEVFKQDFCLEDAVCKNLFEETVFLAFAENKSREEFFKLLWDCRFFLDGESKAVNCKKDENLVWEPLLSYILGENVSLSIKEVKSGLMEDETQKCVRALNDIIRSKSVKEENFDILTNKNSLVSDMPFSSSAQSDIDEILSHSDVLQPGFLKQKRLEPYFIKKIVIKRRNKKLAKNPVSAGDGWFNMKRPTMTKEIARDLEALQMRSALNPKAHYKRNTLKNTPKIFQMGKVVESAQDFYSSRIPMKQRKRTLAEELISDEKGMMYQKRKHAEIVSKIRGKQRISKNSNKTEKAKEKALKKKKGLINKGSMKNKGILKHKNMYKKKGSSRMDEKKF